MKILYLIYQYCIVLPIMLVCTILLAIIAIVGCMFNETFWGYWPGKIWGWLFYRLFLIPIHIEGAENIEPGQSYVVAANHQSYWDAFLMYGFIGINFKWIMKKEVSKIPFVGWACYMSGHIFLDRSSRIKSMESIKKAESRLKNGMSVVIFPEGTRSYNGQIAKFKRGAFLISQELTLPILPVTIDGNYQVMSRHAWYVTRHAVTMTIHKPILPPDYSGLNEQEQATLMNETAQKVRAVIQEKLEGDK